MTTAPIQKSPEATEGARQSRNIFEDPAIQEAAKNDVFVRFLVQNWRSLLTTLIAVAAATIAYTTYTNTALNKRAAATARLSDIQESYKALVDVQESVEKSQNDLALATDEAKKKALSETIEKQSKELNESRAKLSLIIDSLDSLEPFDTLAKLYRGLLAGRFKDYDGVRKSLAEIPDWRAITDERSSKRFVAETAALGLAKVIAQSEPDQAAAKEQLKALSEKGAFVAVEAVVALAPFATSSQEKEDVRRLINSVRERFPSQGSFLSDVAQRLT